MKAANKGAKAPAELPEGRASTKGNSQDQSTYRTQGRVSVSQAVERIRQAATRKPQEKLTALLHHITTDALRCAFYDLKKTASAGVDGLVWTGYEDGLEERLLDLHGRVHSGAYRALPSRRVEIPKPDGGTRPLGIAALEDEMPGIPQALHRGASSWLPLRQRMLEDIAGAGSAVGVHPTDVRRDRARFARYFDRSPARLGPEQIRAYQVYLDQSNVVSPRASLVVAVSALRFLYRVTLLEAVGLRRHRIPAPKKPRSLPVVLSPEEAERPVSSTMVKAAKHRRCILTTCYARRFLRILAKPSACTVSSTIWFSRTQVARPTGYGGHYHRTLRR